MNIVHSGDHVFLAIPFASENKRHSQMEKLPEFLQDIPEGLKVTWLPIGSLDSEPSVLFVIRPR